MALVGYSSSSDSEAESKSSNPFNRDFTGSTRKRKREEPSSTLPPLPDSFHDLYASTVRTSDQDDPSLHSGRQRQTPHVPGNWPTHVYVEWYPSKPEFSRIASILTCVNEANPSERCHIHSLLESDVGVELPLHISLSRSMALETQDRQPFIDALTQALNISAVQPFELSVNGLHWFANFEGNRWFLVMQLEKPTNDGLNKLLRTSNAVAEAFGQPPLYTDVHPSSTTSFPLKRGLRDNNGGKLNGVRQACGNEKAGKSAIPTPKISSCFHISIGWSLEGPEEETELEYILKKQDISGTLSIDAVKVKIGNATCIDGGKPSIYNRNVVYADYEKLVCKYSIQDARPLSTERNFNDNYRHDFHDQCKYIHAAKSGPYM